MAVEVSGDDAAQVVSISDAQPETLFWAEAVPQ
jgi:hypothetical protein